MADLNTLKTQQRFGRQKRLLLSEIEKEFIRAFVERELKEVERHEHDFAALLSNSPLLSQLHTRDRHVEFLASQEKYHQFLKSLLEKLK